MKISIVNLLLLSLLLFACRNDDGDGPKGTFRGSFYEDCSKTPVANQTFTMYNVDEGTIGKPREVTLIGSFTTDANGYFSIEKPRCMDNYRIEDAKGALALTAPAACSDDSYASYIKNPRSANWVKIITDSAFTAQDTLYVGTFLGLEKRITPQPGPFQNNQVFLVDSTLNKFNPFTMGYMANLSYESIVENNAIYNLPPDAEYTWEIGRQKIEQHYITGSPWERLISVKSIPCNVGDTIVVDLRGYKP